MHLLFLQRRRGKLFKTSVPPSLLPLPHKDSWTVLCSMLDRQAVPMFCCYKVTTFTLFIYIIRLTCFVYCRKMIVLHVTAELIYRAARVG